MTRLLLFGAPATGVLLTGQTDTGRNLYVITCSILFPLCILSLDQLIRSTIANHSGVWRSICIHMEIVDTQAQIQTVQLVHPIYGWLLHQKKIFFFFEGVGYLNWLIDVNQIKFWKEVWSLVQTQRIKAHYSNVRIIQYMYIFGLYLVHSGTHDLDILDWCLYDMAVWYRLYTRILSVFLWKSMITVSFFNCLL